MGQPKIRHIAICTEDTVQLADFYKKTFGMIEVMAQFPGDRQKAIYLSDGYINLAILPARGGREGINHFGFQVDSVEEIGRVGKEAGASTGIAPRPRDGRYAEFRIHDPVGTPIDLAEAGWATEPETPEQVAARVGR
ncbi:MAG TPA: VOC family protein [Chloroflexota bacterium]|nr:VOC family protein [Chloroflexota bacterium]